MALRIYIVQRTILLVDQSCNWVDKRRPHAPMDLTTTPPLLAPPCTASVGDDQLYRILAGGQEEDGQEEVDHEPTGFLGGPIVRSPTCLDSGTVTLSRPPTRPPARPPTSPSSPTPMPSSTPQTSSTPPLGGLSVGLLLDHHWFVTHDDDRVVGPGCGTLSQSENR